MISVSYFVSLYFSAVMIIFCDCLLKDPEDRQKEQQKYGVFYEDDYDYLQHLKDVGDFKQSKLQPVSSLF